MWKFIKEFWGLVGGGLTTLFTIFIDLLDSVELVIYQKVFYISSIILIWIGIYQALTRKRKNKKKILDDILNMEKTNSLVQLVRNPEHKGEALIRTLLILKRGGIKMKAYFKTLSKVQILSLVFTVILLALGVASVFMPELAFVGENLEGYLVALGFVAGPGILSRGQELGDAVKNTILSKGRIKELNQLIKVAKKERDLLDADYAYLKPVFNRITQYGGKPTAEQDLANNNFITQRAAIDSKLQTYDAEIQKLKEDV